MLIMIFQRVGAAASIALLCCAGCDSTHSSQYVSDKKTPVGIVSIPDESGVSQGRGIITKSDRQFVLTPIDGGDKFLLLLEGPAEFSIVDGRLGFVYLCSDKRLHYFMDFFGCQVYSIDKRIVDLSSLRKAAEHGRGRRRQYLSRLGFREHDEIPTLPVGPCRGFREWYDSLSDTTNELGIDKNRSL